MRGIVQGVGFRPFVFSLARRYGLAGSVCNDPGGVHIQVEGPVESLDLFLRGLREEAPPLSVIEAMTWRSLAPLGERDFRIEESRVGTGRQALISPDVATCEECLRELFDHADRRYRYPFINCTSCGPRFTITRSVPYDRAMTTMADFIMCPACHREYDDPGDRRFHAQPNACPRCGPRVQLLDGSGREVSSAAGDPLRETARLLRGGAIVAIKGLGGYHLACDPFNREAVGALRNRKARQDKPFALMARDLAQARALCDVGPEEEALLAAPARPIVLLERRGTDGVAEDVAPRQRSLGIMLAYTPLHHLLLHDAGGPLVMTSGNRSDEPIAYRDDEALAQLGRIADYFLVHDRPIHMRCDDTVTRVIDGEAYFIRRSRGYAPAPLGMARSSDDVREVAQFPKGDRAGVSTEADRRVGRAGRAPTRGARTERLTPRWNTQRVPGNSRDEAQRVPGSSHVGSGSYFCRQVLACGGELKNTFCLARGQHAFLSHHIGDLENYETLRSFREGVEHYCRLFDVRPELVAYDLHPEYLSSKYARELEDSGLPAVGVQHHHAHVASCLADNGIPDGERVIGVALDGTGYGTDGAIWGGEFLEGSIRGGFVRRAHLAYIPLPGGQAAIRQPWRMAVSYLLALYGESDVLDLPLPAVRWAGERKVRLIGQMVRAGINSPPTSSAGRLFDAVAALLGVPGSGQTTYEGQAAVELELVADESAADRASYPFHLREGGEGWVVETGPIVAGVVEDLLAGRPAGEVALRFHGTVAEVVVAGCERIRWEGGVDAVALSGGTFQNRLLLRQSVSRLRERGFSVYAHRRVPSNDGGLALGQAVLANSAFRQADG